MFQNTAIFFILVSERSEISTTLTEYWYWIFNPKQRQSEQSDLWISGCSLHSHLCGLHYKLPEKELWCILCTMESSSPCPLCWVKCQVRPLGQARWYTQHNGQGQGHSMVTWRSGVADSMIWKNIHILQTHFGHYCNHHQTIM